MKALAARLYKRIPHGLVMVLLGLAHARFSVRVAGVFFTPDNRVLMLRHVFRHSYPWGVPSGFLDAGESPSRGFCVN